MRYRTFFQLLLVLFCLQLGGCTTDKDVVSPDGLFGRDWYNSFETDNLGNYTYRPFNARPLGWGRDGFRMEADGRFIRYTQGPADEPLNLEGTWTKEDEQRYRIEFKHEPLQNYTLYIRSVENGILKARRQ